MPQPPDAWTSVSAPKPPQVPLRPRIRGDVATMPAPGKVQGFTRLSQQPASASVPSPPSAVTQNQKECSVFVCNLTLQCSEPDLLAVFQHIGQVKSVKIVRDTASQISKCYGFVEYENPNHAQAALFSMDGAECAGGTVRVRPVTDGPQQQPVEPPQHPAQPAGIPPQFERALRASISEVDGTSGVPCRFGRLCKHVTCNDVHTDGRDLENNLQGIICKFSRKCKRTGCFYVHPSGRDIDDEPERAMCMYGVSCDRLDCMFNHPAERLLSKRAKFLERVPRTPGATKVLLTNFPQAWAGVGVAELQFRAAAELRQYGEFKDEPVVTLNHKLLKSSDPEYWSLDERAIEFAEATVEFLDPNSATQATSGDSSFKVELVVTAAEGGDGKHHKRDKNRTIFVGNVPYDGKEEEVRELFGIVGEIDYCRLVAERRKETGEHRGYSFVDFFDPVTAQVAVRVMHGVAFKGRRLRVTLSAKADGDAGATLTPVPDGVAYAIIHNMPENYLALPQDVLVQSILPDLEMFGPLVIPPTVYDCGTKVLATFTNSEIAEETLASLEWVPYKINVFGTAKDADRSTTDYEADRIKTIFVGNLEPDITELEIAEAFQAHGDVSSVRLVTKNSRGGPENKNFAFVEFEDPLVAQSILTAVETNEFIISGCNVNVSACETSFAESRKSEGNKGRKKRAREGEIEVEIYVDQLRISKLPAVAPSATDREVWVDPLPNPEDEQEWLQVIGPVEEIFRIEDPSTGEPGERGYVKFHDHESASQCVQAGVGEWSQSERILRSQDDDGDAPASYPDNVVRTILGPKGENTRNLKESIGAFSLAFRGDRQTKMEGCPKRLRFVCSGLPEVLMKLQDGLEELMDRVYTSVADKITEKAKRNQRLKRKHARRAEETLPPPPGSFLHTPILPSPSPPAPPGFHLMHQAPPGNWAGNQLARPAPTPLGALSRPVPTRSSKLPPAPQSRAASSQHAPRIAGKPTRAAHLKSAARESDEILPAPPCGKRQRRI